MTLIKRWHINVIRQLQKHQTTLSRFSSVLLHVSSGSLIHFACKCSPRLMLGLITLRLKISLGLLMRLISLQISFTLVPTFFCKFFCQTIFQISINISNPSSRSREWSIVNHSYAPISSQLDLLVHRC